ncbi:MAG: NAD(P)H-dependent oxidoreductase subunit E [Oscillospiraceae bacterium]|nr:NAD(P)H-dependent oxidoreductase subunit E [Oscillospiraceae bacterium]
MAATKSKILPFNGTQEQAKQLSEVIDRFRAQDGALISVLHKAQQIYGYLPIEVQKMIADGLSVPLEKVYGVVTFYSAFSLYPKGRHQISVCMGTACYVQNAGAIFEELCSRLGIKDGECTPDGKFSLDSCRCVGACSLAPIIIIDEKPYGKLVVDDIKNILAEFKD